MVTVDYTKAVTALQLADPILGKLITSVGACQLDKAQQSGDLFNVLARSIIYQQLSTKAATAIYRRFVQLYHQDSAITPNHVLQTPDEILRGVGISRPKIRYLKDLANQVANGFPTLVQLEAMDDEEVIQTLIPLNGVGRWTAQMLLIFRFHRWDVLPVDDLGVRAGIRRLYGFPEFPDARRVREIGESWKPYRTIASWYLWQSLELK